jgi:hypothetical protein
MQVHKESFICKRMPEAKSGYFKQSMCIYPGELCASEIEMYALVGRRGNN